MFTWFIVLYKKVNNITQASDNFFDNYFNFALLLLKCDSLHTLEALFSFYILIMKHENLY